MSARYSALESLFGEIRVLFHRLGAAVDDLHLDLKISAGERGVLEGLSRHGPRTVPAMARARPVSRQHIQTIVNGLLDRGLVRYDENPAHKRSQLVLLSPAGEKIIGEIKKRERRLLTKAGFPVTVKELEAAVNTLRAVRDYISSKEWQHLVRSTQ